MPTEKELAEIAFNQEADKRFQKLSYHAQLLLILTNEVNKLNKVITDQERKEYQDYMLFLLPQENGEN